MTASRPGALRSDERRSNRRQAILEVAAKVFATKGYTAATVRDVADRAGILSGSLYHHFASKDEMLAEILTTYLDRLVNDYRTAATSPETATDSFRRLLEVGLTAAVSQRSVSRIVFNDQAYLDSTDRFAFVRAASDEVEAMWVEVIRRGQEAGEFDPTADPDFVYRAAMGTILSATRWNLRPTEKSVARVASDLAQMFLLGITPRPEQ